jgi:tripartite-type tricarboxylate transporter receptor subunit TctC
MKLPRRQFLHLAAAAAALPAISRIARPQTFPARPITMIVPFPAGGSLDTIGRFLAERMRVSLGQPIVIENVSGGGQYRCRPGRPCDARWLHDRHGLLG